MIPQVTLGDQFPLYYVCFHHEDLFKTKFDFAFFVSPLLQLALQIVKSMNFVSTISNCFSSHLLIYLAIKIIVY